MLLQKHKILSPITTAFIPREKVPRFPLKMSEMAQNYFVLAVAKFLGRRRQPARRAIGKLFDGK